MLARYVNMLLLCLLFMTVGAQTASEKPLKVQLGIPKSVVLDRTLPNGLRVLVKESHRAPVVTVHVWYKVGGVDEPTGLTGISHALEHMMFRGSLHYPESAYTNLVTGLGGEANAFTTADATVYYATVPASEISDILSAEADRMRNLSLKDKDFIQEIKVVREERRMRSEDAPLGKLYEHFMAKAFLESPYRHPVVGWATDLEHMDIADLREWYRFYYAPNHAVVVVVGDVDADWVLKKVTTLFSDIPASMPKLHKVPVQLRHQGQQTGVLKHPTHSCALMLGYHVPTWLQAHTTQEQDSVLSLMALASVMGDGYGSRFERDLVRTLGIATEVNVSYEPLSRFETQWMVTAVPAQEVSCKTLEKHLLQSLERLRHEAISVEELARLRTKLVAAQIFGEDDLSDQADRLGELAALHLPLDWHEQLLVHINQLTPEKLRAAAWAYFVPDRLTLFTLLPDGTTTSQKAPMLVTQGGEHVR